MVEIDNSAEAPPSYMQTENTSVLRLSIVNNPRNDKTSRCRTITASPISLSGIYNDLDGIRTYHPKYMGMTKFNITCPSQPHLCLSYTPTTKDLGKFGLAYPEPGMTATEFDVAVRCPRIRFPHVNVLLERIPPIAVQLCVRDHQAQEVKLSVFTWRAVVPSDRNASNLKYSDSEVGLQNIDLVLLGGDFKEYAYFTNKIKPLNQEGSHFWGILQIKIGVEDTNLVDQMVISLLGLLQMYMDKAVNSGRWSDVAVGMLTGSIMCAVM